jgi:hypothetical protein
MFAGRFGAGIALIVLTTVGASADAAAADRWAPETGEASASAVLASCLTTSPSMACVRAAYTTCEAEHGTMAQRDLNDCAAYSKRAWEGRIRTTFTTLQALAQRTDVQSASGRDIYDRLRTSQQLWCRGLRAWHWRTQLGIGQRHT